jgi:hypothetical protein
MVNIQLINVVDRHRFDADPYPDPDPIQVLHQLENQILLIPKLFMKQCQVIFFYLSRQRHRFHNQRCAAVFFFGVRYTRFLFFILSALALVIAD